MKVNIIMVRHGETTANRSRVLQGHRDYALNENGREQARRAARALATQQVDDIYVSDLSRAYDTASAIVHQNRSFGGDARRMTVWPIMRERTFGVFEGKGIDLWNEDARRNGVTGDLWQHKGEGAESLLELRKRSADFFDLLAEDLVSKWMEPSAPMSRSNSFCSSYSSCSSDDGDSEAEVEARRVRAAAASAEGVEDITVLVVAHGVLMKELLIHLAEERGVKFPCPGREYASVSPNAGFTRLTLEFDEESRSLKSIHCPSMFEVGHMKGLEALRIEASPPANAGAKKEAVNNTIRSSQSCADEEHKIMASSEEERAKVQCRA